MQDCSVEAPACTLQEHGMDVPHWHDTGDCGSSVGAGLFFFGFFVMVFCEFNYFFIFYFGDMPQRCRAVACRCRRSQKMIRNFL
jgi:hypothetical protein